MRATTGLLRPQQVHSRPGWCRVGLVATTALLLDGDTVELDVEVGPGARLDLFAMAGTVALNGRGLPAAWHVRIRLGCEGRLRYGGQPIVVATGARVSRSLQLDVADGGQALLRDTVVLGRYGEQGGWLRSTTVVRVAGELVLLEDQVLDPSWRELPGLLGDRRVLDTISALGHPLHGVGSEPAVSHFRLPGSPG
jgi:urease accessory protein